MKAIASGVIAALVVLSFAGCETQTETTTTKKSTQRTSATDTSSLDPSRNQSMQPSSSYNSMGSSPR